MKKFSAFSIMVALYGIPAISLSGTSEFEEWKKSSINEYQAYLSEEQKAFQQMLKSDWEGLQVMKGSSAYKKPKIEKPPVAPEAKKAVDKPLNIVVAPAPIEQTPPKKPTMPVQPPATPINNNKIKVGFLGGDFYISPIKGWKSFTVKPDKDAIADNWAKNVNEISPAAADIIAIQQQQKMEDWATILLVREYSGIVSKHDYNSTVFLTWAILLEMGYDARIAYDSSNLYLMLPSKQTVYGNKSATFAGIKYYIISDKIPDNSVYTYKHSFEGKKQFDFSFGNQIALFLNSPSSDVRKIADSKNNVTVSVGINPELATYYRTHPQLHFEWYFKAKPETEDFHALVAALKAQLSNYNNEEKVQVILSLIQYGFNYELDETQWGGEYYAAPMHTVMLDAVDCEDRSFLFSYLVEAVTGLKTIGLHYPGHLAVAVDFGKTSNLSGKFYTIAGKHYYVTDPTYIGASIGQEMPQFASTAPELITFE